MKQGSAYDRLAPYYREYARSRAAYLEGVDRVILDRAPRGARVLDVGAGDGVRGVRLGRALGASRIVLCEPSTEMAALCRGQGADEVWETPAQALPQTELRFDLITCLWNVLGHLPDRETRVMALTGMRRLLAPEGVIFLDVNNRHNARAYGPWRVALRRLLDRVVPDDRRGDTTFKWRIGETSVTATGHLFTLREIEAIMLAGGLAIVRRVAVDYLTGALSDDLRDGQLLIEARSLTGTVP